VEYLISKGALDPNVLRQRHEDEVSPYAQIEEPSTASLALWLGEVFGQVRGEMTDR
jgi:hypothetical protein